MSAYVVEDEVINRIVSHFRNERSDSWYRRKLLEETGCDVLTDDGFSALGNAMFALNCQAVDARYGAGESQTFRDDMEFRPRYELVSEMAAYQSLRCWLYQCSEGDIPETSLLYETMKDISAEMAHEIIAGLPSVKKAAFKP